MNQQSGPEGLNRATGSGTFEDEMPGPRLDRRRLLRRSQTNRVVAGVCGGLGRYFDAEPVLFRVGFLVLLVPGGIGLFFYLIAWISIPEFKTEADEVNDNRARPLSSGTAVSIAGGLLIVTGLLILLERFVGGFDMRIIGGIVLIGIGILIVIRGLRGEATE